MKKLTSTLGVFALAIGVAGAFAMSPAPKKVDTKSSDTTYHWFRLSDGTYLFTDTEENKQEECGDPEIDCVRRADGIDPNGNPTGTQVVIQGDKQL